MSEKLLHGQMSVVDGNGDVTILHQETSATDVLVDRTGNTQGTDSTSTIPANVDTLQKLMNVLGHLAFKSKIDGTNLPDDADFVVINETTDGDVVLPESEINDNVTSLGSTWSSQKISDAFNELSDHFYIPLSEDVDGNYTTETTVAEIETAYQNEQSIWILASGVVLPLRQRVDANTWIFSGYTNSQAYDITITANDITITYEELVTMSTFSSRLETISSDITAVNEGVSTGLHSFAENSGNASGDYSHAGGIGTKAIANGQAAFGTYNEENASALFVIGNGTSDSARSNAIEVYSTHTKAKVYTENEACIRNILTGTSTPTDDIGENGDIYLMLEE